MSERLKQGLAASRSEIQAGLAEAEAELQRARQHCRELEELIALGKATLLAARLSTEDETVGRTSEPAQPASAELRSRLEAAKN